MRDIYNYLEAYSEPCHLSKIELFVIVNQWEALNIFTKKLKQNFLINNCLLNGKKNWG